MEQEQQIKQVAEQLPWRSNAKGRLWNDIYKITTYTKSRTIL
jgi:hypothetical protein